MKFLLLLDKAVPHLHQGSSEPEGAIISMPLRADGMKKGTHSNLGTVCFSFGFTLMLALDVALG